MRHRILAAFLLTLGGGLCVHPAPAAADAATTLTAPVTDPAIVDAALRDARAAAREDRHAAAIDAYARAFAAAPERRREWLLESADQHTWAERLDEAIALYREAAVTDDVCTEQRARVGLARALSWQGRHGAAAAEYRRALVLDPRDAEAARGLARVQSWRGRHRDAALRMEEHLAANPGDREATGILIDSLEWMGRADRAQQVLHAHVQRDPGDERAASRLANLRFQQRPELRADWRQFAQTDDLEITELALVSRVQFAGGRGHVGPRYSRATYRPPAGPVRDIVVQRPGVEARYRIGDSLEWHGMAARDLIDTRGATGDHALWTHETYVTWWPTDVFRFDVGSSRWTFDSEETLREGLVATQQNASMDVVPSDRTRFSARASRADFSDGNDRTWWQLQAEHRVWQSPRVIVGYRYTGFDFTTPWQSGYYNPDRYRSHEALVQASGWLRDRVYWDLRFAIGNEAEAGGTSRRILGGGALVAMRMRPSLYLELAYDYSGSRSAAANGFERRVARLGVRQRF